MKHDLEFKREDFPTPARLSTEALPGPSITDDVVDDGTDYFDIFDGLVAFALCRVGETDQ